MKASKRQQPSFINFFITLLPAIVLTIVLISYASHDFHNTESSPLGITTNDDGELPIEPNRRYSVPIGGGVEAKATSNVAKVESWIEETLTRNERRIHRLIVGLDVERSPDYMADCDHSVAILQLCVGRSCLIYQILHAARIPRKLREFLENPGYTFVGAGIRDGVERLWEDYGVRVVNVRELGVWAAEEMGKKELRGAGLEVLGREVGGEEILMEGFKCGKSRWDERVLTRKQMVCACFDGYISFEIGRRLSAWY